MSYYRGRRALSRLTSEALDHERAACAHALVRVPRLYRVTEQCTRCTHVGRSWDVLPLQAETMGPGVTYTVLVPEPGPRGLPYYTVGKPTMVGLGKLEDPRTYVEVDVLTMATAPRMTLTEAEEHAVTPAVWSPWVRRLTFRLHQRD